MRSSVRRLLLVAAACAGLAAPRAFAWGPIGHRTVGRIAEHGLSPSAAKAVKELLGSEPLAFVTTWADDIRSEAAWTKAEAWHYVTIPDGQTYETSKKSPDGDILEAIARFTATLGNKSAPALERTQALKWLSHQVGDIHQPLHVGRGDDRGGNETVVLWFNQPSNLHAVWDEKMIEGMSLSFSELAEWIDHASPAEVHDWQASAPGEWARESQELRDACYKVGDRRLSYRYSHDNWPVVQKRLLQAGVRLAGLLNRLLGAP